MGRLYIETTERKLNLPELAGVVYECLGQVDNLKVELIKVSEQEIRRLNSENRGVDKVTDVLSFPTLDNVKGKILLKKEYPTDLDGKYLFLGSIVICKEKIKEQAQEYGHSEERETKYLIIHALMHLFGYDHETEEEKAQMRAKEKAVLKILGIE